MEKQEVILGKTIRDYYIKRVSFFSNTSFSIKLTLFLMSAICVCILRSSVSSGFVALMDMLRAEVSSFISLFKSSNSSEELFETKTKRPEKNRRKKRKRVKIFLMGIRLLYQIQTPLLTNREIVVY